MGKILTGKIHSMSSVLFAAEYFSGGVLDAKKKF
jgi:hypothetical protein